MGNGGEHPWFRPLWRRVAVVVFCAVWAAFELYSGEAFWATIFGGMAAYALWVYIIKYPKPGDQQAEKKD